MSPAGAEQYSAVLQDSSPATLIRIEACCNDLMIMAIDDTGAQTPSPLDLIFSCAICQATVAQLYAEDDGSRALQSPADLNNKVITKIWLTECAHLTCGKHLDGGGAPFHPEGQAPRAPCPLCSTEKGDELPKALFAINGFKKGEYDGQIPDDYFHIPPIQLGGGDAGLQAMRFQYLALVRYGTKMQATIGDVERQLKELKLAKVADAAKVDSLQARTAKQERMTRYWNERAPQITHCLKALQLLVQNLQEARRTLLDLNQDVSSIDQALSLVARPPSRGTAQQHDNGIIPASDGSNTVAVSEQGGESRLAQGSSADLKALNSRSPAAESLHARSESTRVVQAPQPREASSDKRKRLDPWSDVDYDQIYIRGGHPFRRGESRIAMPPPPKVPNAVSNVHAYASPRHRGQTYSTNHFPQLDVHAENTIMTPGLTHYTPRTHYSTSARSQSLETGGDYRSPAVYDRYPTMESNNQDRQYPDTRNSGAATFHGNPEERERVDGWYYSPEPRFEQRAPSTATLNRLYLPQHPSSDHRAPSTATLNRSYLPQHPSSDHRAPSTATLNRSFLPHHSSFSGWRPTPAPTISTPFRAPQPLYPTSYTTTPHPTRPAYPRPSHDGELDHPHRPTASIPPTRRLTLPPTPRAPRTGLLPHMRSSTPAGPSHLAPLTPRSLNPQSAVASPFFGRAGTANQQIWNGLSFVRDPSVAAAGLGYVAAGRRNVQR